MEQCGSIAHYFPGLFSFRELMELDYVREFLPLARLARKFHLTSLIKLIDAGRMAQADRKDYTREMRKIEADIRRLDNEENPQDVAQNWARIHQIANRMNK